MVFVLGSENIVRPEPSLGPPALRPANVDYYYYYYRYCYNYDDEEKEEGGVYRYY